MECPLVEAGPAAGSTFPGEREEERAELVRLTLVRTHYQIDILLAGGGLPTWMKQSCRRSIMPLMVPQWGPSPSPVAKLVSQVMYIWQMCHTLVTGRELSGYRGCHIVPRGWTSQLLPFPQGWKGWNPILSLHELLSGHLFEEQSFWGQDKHPTRSVWCEFGFMQIPFRQLQSESKWPPNHPFLWDTLYR